MAVDQLLLEVPQSAIFIFCGAITQLFLIFYCMGHPSNSMEKWSLVRWLSVWFCFNLSQAIGFIFFATNNIPLGEKHPTEIYFQQIWFSSIVWFGFTGVDFLFRFLKKDEEKLMRLIFILSGIAFIAGWLHPEFADRRSNLYGLVLFPICIIPYIYAMNIFLYKFFIRKDENLRKRTGLLMISLFLGMLIFFGVIIFGITLFKVIPFEYRDLFNMLNTLQVSIFFTVAITKYGALEIGIEEAAEEMFSQMDDPVIILTEHATISRANPVAQSLFNITGHENCHISELIPAFDRNITRFESQVDFNSIEQVFFCTLSNIYEDNEVVGNVLVMRDITEEKRIIEMKNAFLSTVSHELRTPLTSILGFTKIIQKKWAMLRSKHVQEQERKEDKPFTTVSKNIDVIISEGERLTALINNVLDITKMESGTIDWNYEQTNVPKIIEQSIAATQGLFTDSNVQLITELSDVDISIVADKDRLVQVLLNLISNAVKFTQQGTITISSFKRSKDIIISVKDSGVGMEQDDLKKVFEKFQQIGTDSKGEQVGTGLGLPISKEIIEGHGGEIWAESELGVGSTFSFTIPLPQSRAPTIQKVSMQSLLSQLKALSQSTTLPQRQRILIVDDEPSIRQLVRQSLEPAGYRCSEAEDGLAALTSIKQNPPDLIISDVMMPKMNGFDLAAVIKNDTQLMHLPIMMLTVIPDEKRGYGIGVDVYLRKPISPEKIQSEVAQLFDRLKQEKRILLAGNKIDDLTKLSHIIRSLGFSVEAVSSLEQFQTVKGRRMTMIIVESDFVSQSELQLILNNTGQSTTLIRLLKKGV